MQERQMKKNANMQKAKGNLICVQFHTTKPIHYLFLGETWLLNVMIIIQETHRLHV